MPRHWHQWALILAAFGAVAVLLVLPLVLIFSQAFSQGAAVEADNYPSAPPERDLARPRPRDGRRHDADR